MNTDRSLVEALSRGEEQAFDAVFMDYFPKIKNFINGFLHQEEEAENIAQDIFLNIWKERSSLTRVVNLNAYLYKIAKNEAFRYLKKSLRHEMENSEEYENLSDESSPEDSFFAKELEAFIRQAIDKMPDQRKRVFLMSREEGMSNDEIADRLKISKKTVESHLTAALSYLRKIILFFLFIYFNLFN